MYTAEKDVITSKGVVTHRVRGWVGPVVSLFASKRRQICSQRGIEPRFVGYTPGCLVTLYMRCPESGFPRRASVMFHLYDALELTVPASVGLDIMLTHCLLVLYSSVTCDKVRVRLTTF